jgi:hypothetical protein
MNAGCPALTKGHSACPATFAGEPLKDSSWWPKYFGYDVDYHPIEERYALATA